MVFESRMDFGQATCTDSSPDEIHQMERHLVFVREVVRIEAKRFTVVSDSDTQCAAVGVHETGIGLETRQLNLLVRLARSRIFMKLRV